MQGTNPDNDSQINDLLLKIARHIALTDRETDLLVAYVHMLHPREPWIEQQLRMTPRP